MEVDVRRFVDQLVEANARLIDARENRDRWRRMHHEVEAERDRLINHGITEDYVHGLRDQLAEVTAERDKLRSALVVANRDTERRGADRDAIRQAATRVVQLVTHGADGLVVGEAIAELRRVLDGGGQ